MNLNILQYSNMQNLHITKELSLNALANNEEYFKLKEEFAKKYSKTSLNSFSFCKDGFLGLLLELNKKGKIAISKGECEALYEAGKSFEDLGFELIWIELLENGKVDIKNLENKEIDFLFTSSYVMDTFVKTDLSKIKELTNAKIISNASANFDKNSDAIYFDSYKLSGFSLSGIMLFSDNLFETKALGFSDNPAINLVYKALQKQTLISSQKNIFKEKLQSKLKDDLYFFVDSEDTLEYSLHFALKDIKAREIIRTLSFEGIYITNGEGCSLGLSRPSRIVQSMGYEELISRNALSLSFDREYEEKEIEMFVNKLYLKYRQIKALNE